MLQGEWLKQWVRKLSKVLGAAEWYEESRWWSLRRRVQMAVVVRRQRGVKNSPSLATWGGERLEQTPHTGWALWLIGPLVQYWGACQGGCVTLCNGPWRLNMNLKHPGIPSEERKLCYQEKDTSTLLYSNPISQVKFPLPVWPWASNLIVVGDVFFFHL